MQAYKKRAKGGWNQGKACKGDSEERMYSKAEIKQQLAEAEETYLDKHKGKRKPNMKARLEYRVKWYEEILEEYSGQKSVMGNWMGNWMRDGLEKAQKKLAELIEKESTLGKFEKFK